MDIAPIDNLWFKVIRNGIDSIKVLSGAIFCYKGTVNQRFTGDYNNVDPTYIDDPINTLVYDNGSHRILEGESIEIPRGENKLYLKIPYIPFGNTQFLSIVDDVGSITDGSNNNYARLSVIEYIPDMASASYVIEQAYQESTDSNDYVLLSEITLSEDYETMDIKMIRRGIICCSRKTRLIPAS